MEQEFTEFYMATRDDCLRVVLISIGDRVRAEDLVAEAFARAWMSWPKLRQHPARQAWVIRTALNAGVSAWRRGSREVLLDHRDLPGDAEETVGDVDPSLMTAIRKLPRRQRQVLLLRIFFDLDTQLTADLLGLAPGTVGAHLHRAIATLRSKYPAVTEQEVTR